MAGVNLRCSMVVSGGDWHILISRPIVVGLMLLAVAFLAASVWNHKRIARGLAEAARQFRLTIRDSCGHVDWWALRN